MTDKSLKVYVGEDRFPIQDLTSYVNWPESRVMSQAYNGQSSVSELRFRDELAQMGPWIDSPITLAARNEVEIVHGSNFLFRGRLIGRTWGRGVQKADKAREVVAEAEDVNVELRGIIVDGWVRPVETDIARVAALRTDGYLDGSTRNGADLDVTAYVSASNSQTLPAKTYKQTDPLGVMNDIAFQTDKQFFVTIDKELWYDGYDSTAYASPLYITDNPAELKADPTHALAIVPDTGPLFSINGQQFISGVRVYYGSGDSDYEYVSAPSIVDHKAHWEESVYAPEGVTTAGEAQEYARTLLQERSQDGRTFSLSVCNANGGPLTEAQIGSIKPGHLIRIKSRVLPLFPLTPSFYATRIVSLQWHMPLPNQYFATLKLERPEKAYGNGTKPGPQPASAGSADLDSFDGVVNASPIVLTVPAGLTDSLLIAFQGHDNNGGPPSATWTVGATVQNGVLINGIVHPVPDAGYAGAGASSLSAFYILNPTPGFGTLSGTATARGWFILENVNQASPIAASNAAVGTGQTSSVAVTAASGQTVVNAVYVYQNLGDPFDPGGSPALGASNPIPVAGQGQAWVDIESTAGADHEFAGGFGDASPEWTFIDVYRKWAAVAVAVNGTLGAVSEPIGDTGSVGTDTGTYANPDHVHPHGQLSEPSDAHDAADISVTPFTTIAATNVQAALEEVVAEFAAGAPTAADYLVGTAQAGLSAEIVVGTTPGGELGGTWASPTVDATHAGSTHDAATNTHIADANDAHDASAVSFDDTGLSITAADVQEMGEALDAALSAGGIPATIFDAAGDIIVASAADTAARLAAGSEDDVLTIVSGVPAWAAPTGGGGSGNVVAEPSAGTITIPGLHIADRVPASPDALDDEFNQNTSGTPSGWTSMNSPTTVDTDTVSSHLHLHAAAAGGVNLKGVYKAWSPSNGDIVTARISGLTLRNNFNAGGLFIAESPPGKIETIHRQHNNSGMGAGLTQVASYTTPTGTGAAIGNAGNNNDNASLYLRIVYNTSTSITYQFSTSGLPGTWLSVVAARNPGFTVAAIGLYVSSEDGTNAVHGYVDWIRFE